MKQHLPKITIHTIPHEKQVYETVGDWRIGDNKVDIYVSEMNPEYEFLVGIHETIEFYLCKMAGVSEDEVNAFDMDYEESRRDGCDAMCGCRPTKTSEPGFDKHAPYKKQHAFATQIEKLLAKFLKVKWKEYEKTINEL